MHFYFDAPKPKKAASTMRRLLVRCPTTSKLAPTGVTIDETRWAKTSRKSGKFSCPHCRSVHMWKKDDVILAR